MLSTAPIKCIIFDWDGTLLDSASRIVSCLKAAALELQLPVLSPEEYRQIIGLSLDGAFERLYPGLENGIKQQYVKVYKEHFMYKNTDPFALFENVESMLQNWQKAGYFLAIATGKSRIGLKKDLEDFGIGKYFDMTKTADETACKPDPMMLNEILSELDLEVEQAVMIGDTTFDIDMANNINMATVAVAQGAHGKDQLQASKPTVLLDSIQSLPELLLK